MLQEKVWKLGFSLIVFVIFVFSLLGCQSDDSKGKVTEMGPLTNQSEQLNNLGDIKFGLSEKYFLEGVFWYDNMAYYRALYSLSKSLNFNPLSDEVRFSLAKTYLNTGYIRNAIDLLSEIEGDYKPYAFQKISAIYSRLSVDDSTNFFEYSIFTNLKGLPRFDTKVFSLVTTVRFVPKLSEVIFTSFGTKEFGTIDKFMRISKYNYGKEIIDIFYDQDEEVFYILGYNTITKYCPGWFNLNLFNINAKKTFRYSDVVFKKFAVYNDVIFAIDSFSKSIFVINKDSGDFVFSFGGDVLDSPNDIEVSGDKVFVSDGDKIVIFDRFGNCVDSLEVGYNINGFSVVSSNFVISTDSGIFFVSPFGEVVKIYDGAFDDVCLGDDKDIFAVAKDRNNIYVLRDFYLMVANLNVDVKGVFVGSFPTIGLLVGVRDSDGNFVKGLRNEDFEVYESGVAVFKPDVRYTYDFLKKKNLYILVENSMSIQEIREVVLSFVRGILENLSPRDYISLSVFGSVVEDFNKSPVNILSPLDFLEKRMKGDETNKMKFSFALNKAITETLPSLRNNAILVITSGNDDLLDYSDYDFYTLLEYSYNNFIPVYVVSISNNEKLKLLAESTGGKYYSSEVLLSPGIFLNDFRNPSVYRYFLIFTSLYETLFPNNKLVDLEVRVNYKGVKGMDKVKYVFPKIKKKEQ